MSNNKTAENNQFARVANVGGTRDYASAPNDGSEPLCDQYGRLIVVVPGISPIPDPYPNRAQFSSWEGAGLIDQMICSAVPGRVVAINGYNASPTNKFLVIYDRNTFAVIGSQPNVNVFSISSGQPFSYSVPWILTNGLVVTLSSAPLVLTQTGDELLSINGVLDIA